MEEVVPVAVERFEVGLQGRIRQGVVNSQARVVGALHEPRHQAGHLALPGRGVEHRRHDGPSRLGLLGLNGHGGPQAQREEGKQGNQIRRFPVIGRCGVHDLSTFRVRGVQGVRVSLS